MFTPSDSNINPCAGCNSLQEEISLPLRKEGWIFSGILNEDERRRFIQNGSRTDMVQLNNRFCRIESGYIYIYMQRPTSESVDAIDSSNLIREIRVQKFSEIKLNSDIFIEIFDRHSDLYIWLLPPSAFQRTKWLNAVQNNFFYSTNILRKDQVATNRQLVLDSFQKDPTFCPPHNKVLNATDRIQSESNGKILEKTNETSRISINSKIKALSSSLPLKFPITNASRIVKSFVKEPLLMNETRTQVDDVKELDVPKDFSSILQRIFFVIMTTVNFQSSCSSDTFRLKTNSPICADVGVMNPKAFSQIQKAYGETKYSLVSSVCNSGNLQGGPSKGKSSSFFYLTQDDKFLLKTLTKGEWSFLKSTLLENYVEYIKLNQHTLLPRFFICFRTTLNGFSKRFVLMNNVLQSRLKIHEIFDLKGSTVGREVSRKEFREKERSNVAWKDIDFDRKGYYLDIKDELLLPLLVQIEKDVEVLRAHNVMDYSLLLGIHHGELAHGLIKRKGEIENMDRSFVGKNCSSSESTVHELCSNASNSLGNAAVKIVSMISRPFSEEFISMFKYFEGGIRSKKHEEEIGSGDVYFIGIIDILQTYTTRKALETQVKSIANSPTDISCVESNLYAARFFKHVSMLFSP